MAKLVIKRNRKSSANQLEFDYTAPASPKKVSAPAPAPKTKSTKTPDTDPASYIDSQYSGAKGDLRPLYEKLIHLAMKLGKDIRVCPGRTIVPIYRKQVIAQVKASTNTRIDLGLALGKQKAAGRLIDTGGYAKGDRITHRIPVSTRADIDSDVEKWLKLAYESDDGKK